MAKVINGMTLVQVGEKFQESYLVERQSGKVNKAMVLQLVEFGADGERELGVRCTAIMNAYAAEYEGKVDGGIKVGGNKRLQAEENALRVAVERGTDKAATIQKVYGGNGKRGNPVIGYKVVAKLRTISEEVTEFEKAFKAASKLSEMLAALSTEEKAQILAALNKAAASEEEEAGE